MNKLLYFFLSTFFLVSLFSCNKRSEKPRVLVFSKTSGFVHSSIPQGIAAIQKLGMENGFDVDTTKNSNWFTEDTLAKYSAVIFLNTTGDVLDRIQEIAFERYIQGGGGYVGIHSATDTEYDWRWYGRLVGAYFLGHPQQQDATLNVVDNKHPSTKHLPAQWKRKDEWYSFKNLNKDVNVLVTIDEKTYEGGLNGDNHPMAWYHDYDGGRAFYTEFGHTEESYSDPLYLGHVLGGIQYAIGDNKSIQFDNAKSEYPPDEDRFTRSVLTQGNFFEPTELTVLPNLDILVSQRRGEIMLYKNETKQVKQAGFLDVYFKTTDGKGVNAEEGLLGIKADPDFKKNNWVYVFYSPADTSVNRLSRFDFKNDSLDLKSEKVVLQFYSQRNICCHTGGSIAFGPDRTLFVSAGDNSTPFDEPNQPFVSHGYAPLDSRPGHLQYDARRSSGNPNDLRGKIIRIKIKDDGTYEIPEGNLFPPNNPKTRPEIFVMGNRNPYRISVDPKNGYLYWGEVGPDSDKDSLQVRGPKGYDEINQAKKAGFFGWPLFIGNNYAYHAYDYGKGVSGPAFDPAKPINNSPNNTGIQELPPAQPAFIWYPYGASPDFPQVGTGGRTAMAGPAYYTDMFPKESRYPDYYNRKVFIYEWIRNWIKVVTLDEKGDFDHMEPFMEHTAFAAPIDMELGPDGKIYLLEYGKGWFTKNPDAGLSRIDYNSGNRAPKIASFKLDQTNGSLPFTLKATVDASDPEKDNMKYVWTLGDGNTKETDEPKLEYTYTKAGDYDVSVEVRDDKKAVTKSGIINIYAGNAAPQLDIQLAGNKSFYFPGKPLAYEVKVEDKEDASAINAAELEVLADFMEGSDKAGLPLGHLSATETEAGKTIMSSLDCKACHQVDTRSVGPSFTQVAAKYKNDPKALPYLTEKIKKGGSGVWGEVAMPAHPDLPESDAEQIVKWIATLDAAGGKKASLPANGTVVPAAKEKGRLYLTARYTDKGGAGIKPMTAKQTLVFRSSIFSMRDLDDVTDFDRFDSAGVRYLVTPKGDANMKVDSIDLSGISAVELSVVVPQPLQYGYSFELRLDDADGTKVGEAAVSAGATKRMILRIPVGAINDNKFHNLFIVSHVKDAKETGTVRLQTMRFVPK